MQKGGIVQPVTVKGLVYQEDITILNVNAPNKSFKTFETKIDTTAKGSRKIHDYTQIFHHPLFNNSYN